MIGGVPVLDGRKGSPYTRYVPAPNSPHGINTAPDGIHVVAAGKLSPTVTVFDVRKFDDLFDDKIQPRDTVVAEPELGLGPLHTAYDGKGNAYTTPVPRQPGRASGTSSSRSGAFRGEKVNPDPAEDRRPLPARPQPHLHGPDQGGRRQSGSSRSTSSRRTASSTSVRSSPRTISSSTSSGDRMVLVHDGPSFAEPHDATIVHQLRRSTRSHAWKRDDPVLRGCGQAGRPRTAWRSRPTPRSSATATRSGST